MESLQAPPSMVLTLGDNPISGNPESVEDLFTSGDWSVVLGIGFDISKLMIDVRYNIGVSDISNVSISNTDPLKSGVFQLSAGIKF